MSIQMHVGYELDVAPLPVTVTTRIITFLVGNPYKPSFATVTGKGPHPRYEHMMTLSCGYGDMYLIHACLRNIYVHI